MIKFSLFNIGKNCRIKSTQNIKIHEIKLPNNKSQYFHNINCFNYCLNNMPLKITNCMFQDIGYSGVKKLPNGPVAYH